MKSKTKLGHISEIIGITIAVVVIVLIVAVVVLLSCINVANIVLYELNN